MDDAVGIIVIVVIVWFVLFLILREVMCWYWKINKMVGLMQEMSGKLDRLVGTPSPSAPAGSLPDQRPAGRTPSGGLGPIESGAQVDNSEQMACPNCGRETRTDGQFCEHCGERFPW